MYVQNAEVDLKKAYPDKICVAEISCCNYTGFCSIGPDTIQPNPRKTKGSKT